MPVLVTGGAGYIGSHMVLELLDAGETVVVLDNLSTGFVWAVDPRATLVVGDMGDQGLVETVMRQHGIDAVIHFAARIVVPDSVADPLGYYLANTVKTRAVMAACVDVGVRHMIFSSTAAVYGTPEVMPVSEEAPTRPESPYGTSKLITEWMLRDAAAAHDLTYVVLRYFNVAGADPKGRTGQSTPNATHLIKVAVQTALGLRQKMDVFGTDYPTPDGTCVRDYIHVTDLVRAHLAAPRPSPVGWRQHGGELRLRPRLFGQGGHRHGALGHQGRFPRRLRAAPARRCRSRCGGRHPRPHASRLDARPRRPHRYRRGRLRLGTAARQRAALTWDSRSATGATDGGHMAPIPAVC